jgi:flagellum-specific ATP synthase
MYRDAEDLINLGAYVSGANAKLDKCIQARPQIMGFLKQDSEANISRKDTLEQLSKLSLALG